MLDLINVQKALAELGINIRPQAGKNSYFQKYLNNLFSSQLMTNFPFGDVERELQRMWVLINQLRDLRTGRPDIFKRCINNLNKHSSEQNFWGYRFELHIAHQLLRKKIDFKYRERPDFSLQHKGSDIYVECGSGRITQSTPSIHLAQQKLFGCRGIINRKSTTPYMNFRTALFLDITNLVANTAVDIEDLKQETARIINQASCGAIALVVLGQNKETRKIGYLTVINYHDSIDGGLRDFLVTHFPKVEKRIINLSVFIDT